MTTTVTDAYHSIWRHLFDSMHAKSKVKFVDNEQINFVVGNRGSVVESDFSVTLSSKSLMYKKERKIDSSQIM